VKPKTALGHVCTLPDEAGIGEKFRCPSCYDEYERESVFVLAIKRAVPMWVLCAEYEGRVDREPTPLQRATTRQAVLR
jgi:hypothetical protein